MTIENRLIASLSDIKAIQISCKKCGYRVSRSPDKAGALPSGCPQCEDAWTVAFGEEPQEVKLMRAIEHLRRSTALFEVRLEFDATR